MTAYKSFREENIWSRFLIRGARTLSLSEPQFLAEPR